MFDQYIWLKYIISILIIKISNIKYNSTGQSNKYDENVKNNLNYTLELLNRIKDNFSK